MRITTDLSHFNQDEDDVIYRVVQESITNAIRHGKASEIYITIDRRDGDLHIIISDNGVGCDSVTEGFGLHHMKERLEMLGGHMEYTGNAGFTIHALIPIRWGNEN
jgi:signal transduction histidine kinase